MGNREYDFAGWVTKNDIMCLDGVTIKHDAFKDNDGQKVPLVWNHDYSNPNNVLGHVILHSKDQGVYGYGYFNDTEQGVNAKSAVKHGDVSSMSIGARGIKRTGNNVIHGLIYEVSLVLAGANPGAMIESVVQHSADGDEEKATIFTGNLIHSADDVLEDDLKHKAEDDNKERTIEDVINTMNDEQKDAVAALLGMVADPEDDDKGEDDSKEDDQDLKQSIDETKAAGEDDTKSGESEEDAKDGEDGEDDKEQQKKEDTEQTKTDDEKGDDEVMKQNVFAGDKGSNKDVIMHGINDILKQAQQTKAQSLRDLLAEAEIKNNEGTVIQHGINSIEMLFPEAAQSTNGNQPILYKDTNTGFEQILSGVTKSPFSRVKTLVADLTEDEARAKGYIKGNMKKEEFFSLIKRVTTPTTVYKKQKLDRDDIIDITDFDVVAFMNVEMRMMLREEIARAILVGDGRDFSSEDKINESNIRPIISDNEFFTIHKGFTAAGDFIEAVILSMSEYRGSGRPDMFIDSTLLANVKLLKADDGRYLFGDIPSDAAVANRLGLNSIVPTTFMTGKGALIVNLRDYQLGATKGGEVTNFDDFDIDFNQYKYLIETRLSGALTMPKSAIHLQEGAAATGADNTKGGLTYGSRQADKTEPPVTG